VVEKNRVSYYLTFCLLLKLPVHLSSAEITHVEQKLEDKPQKAIQLPKNCTIPEMRSDEHKNQKTPTRCKCKHTRCN